MGDRKPPAGTVTFLFTDIEGSTWLLQHLGDAYDEVLHDHHRLLRDAWTSNDGYEVSTEGDAFFVTFESPAHAMSAAVAAQRAVRGHAWPGGIGVRVRMGMHTGEVRVYGGDYVGLAVHQAARIAAAAHGGQVLVSEASRVDGVVPEGASLVDLGPHRLKDLAQALRLYSLVHADWADEAHPPPRTLSVLPNNFPLQLTTFVGRDDEIDELRNLLGEARLVTLTGAGGVGKTRLSLQVGAELLDDFPDGAWWVDLAPLSDPQLVANAVADVLGLREQPGRPIIDTVRDHLLGKKLLIVLDNCEHLIDSCAKVVNELLSSCPYVKVLATSREALSINGETAWRLPSLGLPGDRVDVADLARVESVRLFVQRARSSRPGFDLTPDNATAIAQLCRRLDGLPLAIELAAARARSMSVQDIASRLDDRFRLLTGGSRLALPRQRTLEATVAWSYESLAEPEQMLFDRLSVFAGGHTLDAAEEVCADTALESFDVAGLIEHLAERSLVLVEDAADGATRFRMLETLRQFGRDRLIARGEVPAIRDRHLVWATGLAERSPPQGGSLPSAQILPEEDNIRVALEWALETEQYEAGLRIMGSAWIGHFEERTRTFKRFLPHVEGVPDDVRAKALFAAGGLAFMSGDWEWGVETLHPSVQANAAIGDGMLTAMSLTYAGACHWGLREMNEARVLMDRGIEEARAAESAEALSRGLLSRAWLETERDVERAEEFAVEGEAEAAGLELIFNFGHLREVRAYILCLKGDYTAAAEVLAEAVHIFNDIQRNCGAHILETASAWAAMTGRFELGAELLGASERIREDTGDKPRPWEHVVQEEYLPRIRAALDPTVFAAAHARGMRKEFHEALAFAEHSLRTSITG